MVTLTEQYQREKDERKARMIEDYVECFIKRWSPHDEHDRARFTADFFTIMRQLHLDAAELYANKITEMYARMPMPPMIFRGPAPEVKK